MRTSALGAAAFALPGCVSLPTRRSAAGQCLAPVDAAPNRVIRSVVGLRPYRASGFVVRREMVGDTAVVHNYGHGGAGITLSWGTSRLAVDLGLQGHSGPAAVLGSGVMGLTTASLLQEAGVPVRIYTAALPPETTSNIAGGQWSPHGHYRESRVSPAWRAQYHAALDYSWRRFQLLVGDDYGVRWLTTYVEGGRWLGGADPLERFHPAARRLTPQEHPFPLGEVGSYRTMYVETGRFLRQLVRDVQLAGGSIAVRRLATREAIAALPERLVFNCTGLGSRELFGDAELRPARGQLAILLPQPEVDYAFSGSAGYMFPRPDGIVLGGTFDLDNWSTEPSPATTATIVQSHRGVFEAFRCTPPPHRMRLA